MKSSPLTLRGLALCTFIVAATLLSSTLSATHVSGATVEYTANQDGSLDIDLQVLQKCYETNILNSMQMRYVSLCDPTDWGFFSVTLDEVASVTSDTCSVWTPGEDCPDGLGHFKITYSGNTTLPNACDQYRIYFKDCNRSSTLNVDNSTFPCLYVHAVIDQSSTPTNTSSAWHNANVPAVCVGEASSYALDITDADGDSLVYSLIAGLQNPGGNTYFELDYEGGFSGQTPMPGVTLDAATGQLDFTLYNQGSYLIVVEVAEYRQGAFVGSTIRDFIIQSKLCYSEPLDIDGIGLSSNGGDFNYFSPDSIVMCPGQNVCGQISFSSGDEEAIIEVIHDMESRFPMADIEVIGSNPSILSFCLAHDESGEYRTVQVDVTDNGCPITQTIDFVFGIFMDMPMTAPELILADEYLGLADFPEGATFQWYRNGLFMSGETESLIDVSTVGGDYAVEVTTRGGCQSWSNTVTVEVIDIINSLAEHQVSDLRLYPNPAASQETLIIDHGLATGTLLVLDASGRMVMEAPINDRSDMLSLAHLESGLYHFSVLDRSGRLHSSARLVVK